MGAWDVYHFFAEKYQWPPAVVDALPPAYVVDVLYRQEGYAIWFKQYRDEAR